MGYKELVEDALSFLRGGHSLFHLHLMGFPDEVIQDAFTIYNSQLELEFEEDNEDDAYGGPH